MGLDQLNQTLANIDAAKAGNLPRGESSPAAELARALDEQEAIAADREAGKLPARPRLVLVKTDEPKAKADA